MTDRQSAAAAGRTWPGTLVANPVLPAEIPVDGGKEAAEHLLAAGADLIALGRPFLANPDLAARMRTGAPFNAVRAKYAMYTGGSTGYTDYPRPRRSRLTRARSEFAASACRAA